MKTPSFLLLLICLGLAGKALAQEPYPIPQGKYACHVKTENGVDGIVFVQANTNRRARDAAIGARAFTGPTASAVALEVVECVSQPGGLFLDSVAMDLMRNLVL